MSESTSVPAARSNPSGALSIPGDITRIGLALPDDLSEQEWLDVGVQLKMAEQSLMWWVGDWARYGSRFGDGYQQQMAVTGYSYSSVTNAVSVADRFDFYRRRENLSWSMHAEVASLAPDEQDELLDLAEAGELKGRKQLRAEVQRRKRTRTIPPLPAAADDRWDIRTGDFRRVLDDLDGTVDAIVTDPPYPAGYLPLLEDLSEHAARILKPGGICAVMIGQSYLPDVYQLLTRHLDYHWTIAYLTPGGQAVQLWDRRVNTFWKPVVVLTNGPSDNDRWIGDVTRSDVNDNDKRYHHWGQSESGTADLIARLTDPGELICDPFTGGGTTAAVAVALDRRFVGAEIDPDVAQEASTRIGREVAA